MTVNSRIIKTFLSWSPDAVDVPLTNGLRVQILPTMSDLRRARKHQFAAFIAYEGLLVVWDDDATNLVPRAQAIEKELMELVWKHGRHDEEEEEDAAKKEKAPETTTYEADEETGEEKENRHTNLINSTMVAFTLLLIMIMLGAGLREIMIASLTDNNWLRVAFLALIPIQIFFTLVYLPHGLFASLH